VVTGGAGGIGAAVARSLAQAGISGIAINYRKSAREAEELAEEIARGGVKAIAVQANVQNDQQVRAMIAQIGDYFGRLDILINNAGINIRKPLHQLSLGEWRQVIDTNLTSAYLCCHAAYPLFKAAGGGKIINIGSMMSIFGASFAPAYGASKGGIVQLTRSAAAAWAPDNIQVNAVLPGWIDTDLTRRARREVPGLNESVLRRTPAGRWGVIDDMAGVAAFLAGPASDFVTGAVIPVDGGFSIQG
jgi:2-deoxy-D-gluconate 3-dehydrogenase